MSCQRFSLEKKGRNYIRDKNKLFFLVQLFFGTLEIVTKIASKDCLDIIWLLVNKCVLTVF